MNTRQDQIDSHLAVLRRTLLPVGCIGIRTDYVVTRDLANRRTLVIERYGHPTIYCMLSTRENIRARGVKSLTGLFQMKEETANEVLDHAEALSNLNDMGAWPLTTASRPGVILGQFGIEGRAANRYPGLQSAYDFIRDGLSQIDRIELSMATGVGKRGSNRKAWMHFYDGAGDQVAAIATNLLASSLREFMSQDESNYASADKRLGRWAHQINVDQAVFIEAAMYLINFDTLIGITRVDLKGG